MTSEKEGPKKPTTNIKNITTIEDYLGEPDLDAAFKEYDKHDNPDLKNHLFNNIFAPAQDEMYNEMVKSLNNSFDDDTASVHNKKEELQKAAVAGLTAFFKKSNPGILKTVDDGMSIEEKYKLLSNAYDKLELGSPGQEEAQQGLYGIQTILEINQNSDKAKVGSLKRMLYSQKSLHADRIQNNYTTSQKNHALHGIESHHIAQYLKDKANKLGFEIGSKADFYTQSRSGLLELRKGLEKGEWSKSLEAYHLKKKKEEAPK